MEDDQENNNGLDDTWECVPHTCVTDKRSGMYMCMCRELENKIMLYYHVHALVK